jgi:hypothetical protein
MAVHTMEVASIRMDVVMGNDQTALLKTTKVETLDIAIHLGPCAMDPLPCYQAQIMRTSIHHTAINRLMIQSPLAEVAMAQIHGATRQILVRKIAPWTDFQPSQRNLRVTTTEVSATQMDHTLLFHQATTASKLSGKAQMGVPKPPMAEMNT